jgi:outer membrane protein assembly factor BamB
MPLRSSPIAVDSLLYVVADDGHMSALDVKTGEPVWSERLEGNFSASLILVNGKLLACNEQGKCYWIEPGKEYKLVGTNTLDSGLLASPVVVGGALILRAKTHVYSIRKE